MTTITDLFNYVNSYNLPAIKNTLENKNQLDKIKWNCKKQGQYILSRCVEIHAKECFELLIDTIEFFEEAYEMSFEIAKNNYFNFQSDDNFYYVKKILDKKHVYKIRFIKEIIRCKNISMFIQNAYMIDYSNIIEITSYLINCIYHGNIQIFPNILSNPHTNVKNIYDRIIKEIYESKYAKIFLNTMKNYGFVWTQLASIDFLSMSDNCFEYYLEELTQLKPEDFKKPEFDKLVNYTFINDCVDYQISRFYHILKLPIEFKNLRESFYNLIPYTCKNNMVIVDSYDMMLNTLYMLFELKPEQMKKIDLLSSQLDNLYKLSVKIKENNKKDKFKVPFVGYIFFQELFNLLKSKGYVLYLEYYQALENFTSKAELEYNKWKNDNNLVNKLDKQIKKTKNTKAKAIEIAI